MIDINEFITRPREERRSHLDLTESCCERGGNSTNHKGVLAQYLNTTIPSGRILLCHGCNNDKCSNPKHLYWGTDYDNIVYLFDKLYFNNVLLLNHSNNSRKSVIYDYRWEDYIQRSLKFYNSII